MSRVPDVEREEARESFKNEALASWAAYKETDRHLIATFHYYEPFPFTHQGASWAPADIAALKDAPFGTPEQIAQVGKDFDAVKAWSVAHDRPVLLGEVPDSRARPRAEKVMPITS